MSSILTQKQQQRRRINDSNIHRSRNSNAYTDCDEYHRQSLINNNSYWNHDYYESYYPDEYYPHRNTYSSSFQRIRKGRQIRNEQQQYSTKSGFSSASNNNHSYYDNIPPRHRHHQQQPQQTVKREQPLTEFQESNQIDPIKHSNSLTLNEQSIKPLQSASSSSTNSDLMNHTASSNRKDLHTKNLAAAAIAARQQNPQSQTNIGVVQALMNSLILQQQQPSQSQSQSTIQLQYQLTNALLTTMIQQRLKETVLQAQAQQIQAALPTLLAAQALAYQQQGQLTTQQQQVQSTLPSNVVHPGTKFNNRPLVKFPVVRPAAPSFPSPVMMPLIRSALTTNSSRHRLGTNTQAVCSTTTLPTYQQVQEIERGISLDEAIHLRSAVDIADVNIIETQAIEIPNNDIE